MATTNKTALTPSKQWIHFLRSDLWPPTSISLKLAMPSRYLTEKGASMTPVVQTRDLRMSAVTGLYPGEKIRSKLVRKYIAESYVYNISYK